MGFLLLYVHTIRPTTYSAYHVLKRRNVIFLHTLPLKLETEYSHELSCLIIFIPFGAAIPPISSILHSYDFKAIKLFSSLQAPLQLVTRILLHVPKMISRSYFLIQIFNHSHPSTLPPTPSSLGEGGVYITLSHRERERE